MNSWLFKWLTTWEDVWDPLHLERWQSLLDQAHDPHVFATPPLVRAWWLTSQKMQDIAPCFVWGTSTSGAIIFMPLVIVRHGAKNAFLRILQPAGHAEYDYHDPVIHGLSNDQWPHFWEAFESELSTRWQGHFDRAVLGGLRIRPEVARVEITDNAPYLAISNFSTSEDFLVSLGKSLRGDIRRQLRRLEEVGPVSFRVLQSAETATALAWLPEMLAQHSEKWPNSYKLPGFHAALIREALPAGLLHLSELKAGAAVVSRHLGFFHQRRFYWYMPVYDSAYQSYSPGKLHLFYCAVDAIGKRGEFFDLLRGEEGYKRQWAEQSSELFEVSWRGSSPASKLRLALTELVKPALQKLRGVRR